MEDLQKALTAGAEFFVIRTEGETGMAFNFEIAKSQEEVYSPL
jgi:hypothetical protein